MICEIGVGVMALRQHEMVFTQLVVKRGARRNGNVGARIFASPELLPGRGFPVAPSDSLELMDGVSSGPEDLRELTDHVSVGPVGPGSPGLQDLHGMAGCSAGTYHRTPLR